ncbi:NAD(P)/FAD-dependent oxidoreductase [Dietzia aurantiaca]|uniref:flavin-containing monooxygenase n=1 Tax=Dietzia aurantiaca TaxID=983873 RepID=UPI001E50E770|nr:NAD(P)/FAD-dependent oxidoreductase [Dietzia aurantiaca]MCD2262202.1 NAD(P)/FAD-dependent oxidoreductase [Dietzia aurantiaca]
MSTSTDSRQRPGATPENPLDLLIVGAGISGIDLAHHVNRTFPQWEWEIHDAHDDLGGTWHTFRYPGIRSDSDMATFGFPFRPWPHDSTLGGGADIKEYIRDTAREAGALDRLHLRSWVADSDWNSALQLYRVTCHVGGDASTDRTTADDAATTTERIVWARRVHYGAGYYSHAEGYRPEFPGEADFRGEIIHPQQWPENMDYEGRKIVVIGSGATAVTLLPSLEQLGAEVTMLQRTPSYIGPLPEKDTISAVWKRLLPGPLAYKVARFNHGARDMGQFVVAQRAPWLFKRVLRAMQRRFISAEMIDQHFTPDYRPWDQRVCKAPDGDIFRSLQRGARVVTGHIETFTPDGIRLVGGEEIPADVIVTATGLRLQAFGGGTLSIDGRELDGPSQVTYRGMMLAGVPNFSFTVGYINSSWTLRADMVSRYMVKLWKRGDTVYAPTAPEEPADRLLLDFDAGYIRRDGHLFPKQGETRPWRYVQNYLVEIPELAFGDQRRGMAFGPDVELSGRWPGVGSADASPEVAGHEGAGIEYDDENDDDKVGLTR